MYQIKFNKAQAIKACSQLTGEDASDYSNNQLLSTINDYNKDTLKNGYNYIILCDF